MRHCPSVSFKTLSQAGYGKAWEENEKILAEQEGRDPEEVLRRKVRDPERLQAIWNEVEKIKRAIEHGQGITGPGDDEPGLPTQEGSRVTGAKFKGKGKTGKGV